MSRVAGPWRKGERVRPGASIFGESVRRACYGRRGPRVLGVSTSGGTKTARAPASAPFGAAGHGGFWERSPLCGWPFGLVPRLLDSEALNPLLTGVV